MPIAPKLTDKDVERYQASAEYLLDGVRNIRRSALAAIVDRENRGDLEYTKCDTIHHQFAIHCNLPAQHESWLSKRHFFVEHGEVKREW